MHNNTSNQPLVENPNSLNDKSSFKEVINTIVWEDTLPIPENVKPFRIDWEKHEFYLFSGCFEGEPVGNSYTLYGGKLYKNLRVGIEATEYTGEILFGDYFMSDEQDYQVSFKALFLKGLLQEITVVANESKDPTVRKSMADGIGVSVEKSIRMQNSLLFKYLYLPWKFCLRGIFSLFTVLWKFIHYLVFCIVKFLTPW